MIRARRTVASAGTFTLLHRFQGGADGGNPAAPLTKVGGKLYSTTLNGGDNSRYGTAYQVNETGKLKVLYSFTGGAEGSMPSASLTRVDNLFYGATSTAPHRLAAPMAKAWRFRSPPQGRKSCCTRLVWEPTGRSPRAASSF